MPQNTFTACGLSTPVAQGNWSLPRESARIHTISSFLPNSQRNCGNLARQLAWNERGHAGQVSFRSLETYPATRRISPTMRQTEVRCHTLKKTMALWTAEV